MCIRDRCWIFNNGLYFEVFYDVVVKKVHVRYLISWWVLANRGLNKCIFVLHSRLSIFTTRPSTSSSTHHCRCNRWQHKKLCHLPLFVNKHDTVKQHWVLRHKCSLLITKLECGPMSNVMATLPNTGGALCSTPQSLADAHPLLECHAVTLPRRETRWNLQGCPKLPNWFQPLVGRSSPYYGRVEEVLMFNNFFGLSIHALVAKT